MLGRMALALPVALCAAIVPTAAARPGSSAATCGTFASAPFLYSVVIPVSAVQCDGSERRLRIETRLTRDGATVASASRRCRDASVWSDEPGDQVWCVIASGYAGTMFVGEARACESEAF